MNIPLVLKNYLSHFKQAPKIWIAYSGGLDSQVLLHAMVDLAQQEHIGKLHAVHINHGWHVDAAKWAKACQQVCEALNIEFQLIAIDAYPKAGASPEAYARDARYNAFKSLMNAEDYLLTAHHQDDQAETLLLQLLRGAGVKGLASMPQLTRLGAGYHFRPLLNVSRAELQQYASQKTLDWIDDDSNQNLRFNRNFIRHEVIPKVRQRWPQMNAILARVAEHCAEASLLLEELARDDLLKVQGFQPNTLSIQKLLALGETRWRNVFRYWLQQQNLALPTAAQLQRVATDIFHSKVDANPKISWSNIIIRRYKDDIYALVNQALDKVEESIVWDFKQPLMLSNVGVLTAELKLGMGIEQTKITSKVVRVKFRQHGERCQPVDRIGSHPLKKLLQEWSVPPWERKQIPLIYCEESLAAVVGFTICKQFAAQPNEMGWVITLHKN